MDVVLVTADSVRADHCGWQPGAEVDATPTLTGLAEESVTFTRAVAPGPRTLSSVPVSHTGAHFSRGEYGTDTYEQRAARIRDHLARFESLPESLREQGYTTMAFTANPWTSTDTGFDAGFDRFEEVGRTGGDLWSLFEGTPVDKPARLFDRWLNDDTWFCRWRTFYDDVVDAIQAADGPVFAWVFLLDPHNPYLVPRADRQETTAREMYPAVVRANRLLGRTDGRSALEGSVGERTLRRLSRAYRDCIRSVDMFVDRLRSDLDRETALIFHSDHGEAFGEHGTYGHTPTLYEENIHVPCLLHGVGRTETVREPLSTAELPAMIRACVRGDLEPADHTTDYAAARTEDDSAVALRGRRWKYVRTDDGERLYDLESDPGETTDESDEHSGVLSELRAEHEAYVQSLPRASGEGSTGGDERVEDHLRSLGYL
jgi:arylsulfatase